ncbi:TPA: hypothetical protein ACNVUS_000205 [Citrobacter freundii]|uniref:hypothetical protein n=1 Tax=Citrobacter freundii TaxID=546 RepID=UPI0028757605|nr:hypothetical protein [Citrobacter freundii]MDS0990940.1 hypothetical protein [Citrobacter freundii]MDX6980341.1 hypothetical protein [Citrobacter freundii]
MKPTYEELELQLEESQREFRAADATIHNLELKITDMAVQFANAESKCRELAAENAGLKNFIINDCHVAHIEPETFSEEEITRYVSADGYEPETPATADFLAEVRAQARNEGINYAAGRLAAAFNHGFVDKPLTEVCDVVRMILDTKEELASPTQPAPDGLSGEYAEKFLEEFAAQLRKGAAL